jgi:hypothetical protein
MAVPAVLVAQKAYIDLQGCRLESLQFETVPEEGLAKRLNRLSLPFFDFPATLHEVPLHSVKI